MIDYEKCPECKRDIWENHHSSCAKMWAAYGTPAPNGYRQLEPYLNSTWAFKPIRQGMIALCWTVPRQNPVIPNNWDVKVLSEKYWPVKAAIDYSGTPKWEKLACAPAGMVTFYCEVPIG